MRGRIIIVAAGLLAAGSGAQQTAGDDRRRLILAKQQAAVAQARATQLEQAASGERSAADSARAQEAVLGARVRAAEAGLAAAQARAALVDRLLEAQRARLGVAQMPIARLLAALESLAGGPTVVAIAQPGSVDDLIHVRAVLGTALPNVQARTADMRTEVATTRALQASALLAAQASQDSRAALERDRTALAVLGAQHRQRATALGRTAIGESDRALALGEQARDLVDRMQESDTAVATAAQLMRLDGPRPRPGTPATSTTSVTDAYRLPVAGRLVTGLAEISNNGVRSRGLTFAVASAAMVRVPAAGTIRYARRFRDYGTIVIIDHGDGWTSLVTGLGSVDVAPGMRVAVGAPIGRAATGEEPRIAVELRRRGRPVDIAALIG
ncbi:murein hydrolase activator EnvC family protein [uncultured Sphingomonas sp.]|uniref:murein hydrolase activator EnvC family protein n=1 Tax=uncultured Sphingomonas sp. TaxID=158754 RepID=UPI0035CA5380